MIARCAWRILLMKKHRLRLVGTLALLPWLAGSLRAAETWARYEAQPTGSKVKVEGTSTLHDWSVESKLIGGYFEFDQTQRAGCGHHSGAPVEERQNRDGQRHV